jgi:CRISPR-associated RAMP protein (TIGR02581 family)
MGGKEEVFKKLLNQAIVSFELVTQSPLYIKQNTSLLDPTAFDGTYISCYLDDQRIPIIPGTSMKGVFRSFFEKMLGEEACDILDTRQESNKCLKTIKEYEEKLKSKNKDGESNNFDEELKELKKFSRGKLNYYLSCPACKVFGSQKLKSRMLFDDAKAKEGFKISSRSSTPIDRISGAAKEKGLNTFEYVDWGVFESKITLVNFFNWQLKLLLEIFERIDEGILTFGGYSSKGFGRMKVENVIIKIRYYGEMKDKAKDGYLQNTLFAERVFNYKEIKEKLQSIDFLDKNQWAKVELKDEQIL